MQATLDFVREKSPTTKVAVAKKFDISEPGAYQRLARLADHGLIKRSGDEWSAR